MVAGAPAPGRAIEALWALALGLAALLIYLPTVAPSVTRGDGGELQLLAHRLGVPHPPGYPLLLLLNGVAARLPLPGDVAGRVNLFNAVTSAAAMGLFYPLTRALGAGRGPAFLGGLILAMSQRLWMHAQAAEAYGLANAFLLLCLWQLARWESQRRVLWPLALTFGLGLTHHISLRPVALMAVVYMALRAPDLIRQPRRWLPALALGLLPLSLYGLLPFIAHHYQSLPELQGRILDVPKPVAAGFISPHYYAGFANLVFLFDYGRQWLLAGDPLGLAAWDDFLALLRQQFPWPALLLAPVGMVGLWRRRRGYALWLVATGVLLLWAALRFLSHIGEDGDGFISVFVLTGIGITLGIETMVAAATARLGRPMVRPLLVAAFGPLVIVQALEQYPQALARRQLDTRAQALAVLQAPLPPGAVVVGEWHDITPLRYLQRVEGIRPDLWVIHADAVGITILQPRAVAADVPFYVLRRTSAGLRLLPLPPAPSPAITHPDLRRLDPAVTWLGYDLEPNPIRPGQTLRLTFYWRATARPTADWTTFIHLLDVAGEKRAQVDRIPVGFFYPPTAWAANTVIADQYELTVPADLPPGPYRLVFGAYSGDQRLVWADGRQEQPLAEVLISAW
ncbi:MAG: DUF2723 domain-containing protein [Caldilineales bacterium]|nr:DUF2723 domain-containing protein [Caldilineales bacterium]